MQRPRSQRREDLLNASIEYLLENGVADLSLRPLAAKVGSKARLLVYHFGSKDALITDAMLVIRERVQENLAALMRDGRDRKPSQVVQDFWAWPTSQQHERDLRLFFEVHGLALQNPKQYGPYLEGAFTTWVGLMLDYLSSGDKKRASDAVAQFARAFEALLRSKK